MRVGRGEEDGAFEVGDAFVRLGAGEHAGGAAQQVPVEVRRRHGQQIVEQLDGLRVLEVPPAGEAGAGERGNVRGGGGEAGGVVVEELLRGGDAGVVAHGVGVAVEQ